MPFSADQMKYVNAFQRALKAKEQKALPFETDKPLAPSPSFNVPQQPSPIIFPTPGPKEPEFSVDQPVKAEVLKRIAEKNNNDTTLRDDTGYYEPAYERNYKMPGEEETPSEPEVYSATEEGQRKLDALKKLAQYR